MATKIVTKNSSTASAVPTASDLVQGELAVNVADKRLFTEDNGGSIVELGTNPSTIDINAGTIDGTAIGASSASTGAFTTLTASGAFTSRGIDDNADATAITIDSSENVGIGSATANHFSTAGTTNVLGVKSTSGGLISIAATGTNFSGVDLGTDSIRRGGMYSLDGSHLTFYTNATNSGTALTERMRIDSSGAVGIGTSSPSAPMHVNRSGVGEAIRFTDSSTDTGHLDVVSGGGCSLWAGGFLAFGAGGGGSYTERMRIDASGNVGIGTTSPSYELDIQSSSGDAEVAITGSTTNNAVLKFENVTSNTLADIYADNSKNLIFRTNSTTERMRIDSSGNLLVGRTASTSAKLHLENATDVHMDMNSTGDNRGKIGSKTNDFYIGHSSSAANIIFKRNIGSDDHPADSGNETMRIDSSGNLLVGKTASNNGVAGVEASASSGLNSTVSGDTVSRLNRLSSDGEILRFQKDTTTVGSIGTRASQLSIGSADTGLEFNNANDAVIPFNSSTNSGRDNAIDLGISSVRFDDIYATNGTIQTSDRNEKQDIAELSEAEQRVAVACKGLMRKFRWKDSVAEKGDDARIHFGIIAQDLQAAFEAEGLDAGDYAMFISTTWTDEETNEEKTRMGVRYSELLAFIISAI